MLEQLKVHEGEKFLETILLINSFFQKATLLIDDVVQRHTMRIWSNEPEEILYNKSRCRRGQMVNRNKWICDNLTIPHDISRWSDWLHHPGYLNKRSIINKLYSENCTYESSVHSTIQDYIGRLASRIEGSMFNREKAFVCCLEYLLEECAVMCLWAEEKYDFEYKYPSGR